MGVENTAVVECRVPMVVLATCVRYVVEQGYSVRSRSDAIRYVLEIMAATIQQTTDIHFTSTEEAMEYMQNLGLGVWNRSGRGGRPMGVTTLAKVIERERSMEGQHGSGYGGGDIFNMVKDFVEKRREGAQTTSTEPVASTFVSEEERVDVDAFVQRNKATIDAFKATMRGMIVAKEPTPTTEVTSELIDKLP